MNRPPKPEVRIEVEPFVSDQTVRTRVVLEIFYRRAILSYQRPMRRREMRFLKGLQG